jgi:type VI secretion system protein VasD
MTLVASADTNPDATGRPSPVVVRVYQLKTDAAFKGAEFFALFDDDQKVLGPELISRDEFVLAPLERRTIDVAVSGDTRFVGAVAAFRDIRNAEWRGLVPAPRKGLSVAVERARVVLSAVED